MPEQCTQGGAGRAVQAGRCMPAYRCRAFEACSVDAHVRLRGSRAPNTPKIATKIDPESRPGPSLRHLKSGLGCSRSDLGPQRGPRGVLGASWGAPGRSQGRPGELPKAPRSPSGAPEGRRWSAWATCSGSAGAKKAAQVCHRTRDLLETHLRSEFATIFARFSAGAREARPSRSIAPVSKNKGSALCATCRVAPATQPQKSSKIDPKNDRKSRKIESRDRSGARFDRLWALGAARTSDKAVSGRPGAVQLARQGAQVARAGSNHARGC